ncbi:MAG: DUF3150 domain-containing protein [Desulfotalea sp.]
MNSQVEVTVLKHLMVLNLDVNIWTARKKLSPEDFNGAILPPEQLATLGSKRVCNPEDIRIFSTLKSRAVSMLDRIGVRFLGGWGIPVGKAKEVNQELQKIFDEFMGAKSQFLSSYDNSVSDWIKQNTEWKDIIKNSIVSADYVSSRINFNWQLFQLAAPKKNMAHGGLRTEISTLGNTLYSEIAKTAEDAWKKCYAGKTQVSQKALSPLKSIHEKLTGLSFVEPCVVPISHLIQSAFNHIPSKGFIKGTDLLMVQGVLALLRDPIAIVRHGQELIQGATPESILDGLLKDSSVAPVEKAEQVDDATLNKQAIDSLGLW